MHDVNLLELHSADQIVPPVVTPKYVNPRERLIVALDVPDRREALKLVESIGDNAWFYKLGLELFMAGEYFSLIDELTKKKKKVFVDLKFFDVPATVGSAVRQLQDRGATFATVHGNDAAIEAAVENAGDTGILAVTVLTSLEQGDLDDLGFKVDVVRLVLSRAKRALNIGCVGVVSSGIEAEALRKDLGENFLIVVPGIRPVLNREEDDQKRTVDVEDAFQLGADYIVVGRPIRNAGDPAAAAASIQQRIADVCNA